MPTPRWDMIYTTSYQIISREHQLLELRECLYVGWIPFFPVKIPSPVRLYMFGLVPDMQKFSL